MYNNFVKNILTLEEIILLEKYASDINLELSEENATFALFDSNLPEAERYEIPVIIGIEEVSAFILNVIYNKILNIDNSEELKELYNDQRAVRVLLSKILTNTKDFSEIAS